MKCKRDEQLSLKSKVIGKRIRWLRYTKSLSLKEVAVLLDISVPALSKIENGTTDMNLSRLMQIACFFKVTAIALINDEEPGVKAEHTELVLLKEKLYRSEQEVIRLQRRLVELYEGLEKYITSK
jgi:transcriptional regulator with XRE-family HTH domain